MSVRKIFLLIFVGLTVLLSGLVYVAYLGGQNRQALAASEERRFESYRLADELRQSSDDLTRFARLYVSTGDATYEQYFQEVLDIRGGEKERPEDYAGIYWDFVVADGGQLGPDGPPVALQDLMRELSFTEEEFLKLAESEQRSNDLALLEQKAMNAVKGRFDDGSGQYALSGEPDANLAREIMFGDEYHLAKATIMEPIKEFQRLIDQRTATEVRVLKRKARIYGALTLALGAAGLAFSLGAYVLLHRRVLRPVEMLSNAALMVEAGDYSQTVEHNSSDELGHLSSSFNHMTRAIQRDIEAREKTQAELALARDAAHSATRAKSDFLSNMSHELRTPLNGVLGYVQILQRDQSLNSGQQRSLDAIGNCGGHLLTLINDVLDLSKIEAGKLEITPIPVDLSALLDGVRDIIMPKAEEKALGFSIKASPEVPRGIITDPIKLRQVLINLLGNAVKFTPEGAISLRVGETQDGLLRFTIEDTGTGIDQARMHEIFEPFRQAEGGEREGGTGLGLAISRRIAEALGGSLTATSELGEGSCFTLAIPLEETDELKGLDLTAASPGTQSNFCLPPGVKRSVLVADDRETNRDILDQLLTDAGFETVIVDDGDVALEALRQRKFDIFLCDVRMPRMNGIEVVKEIRRDENLNSNLVVAVTASVFPEFRDKALEAGFDDFLMKPLRVSELAEKMSKLLEVEFDQLPTEGDDEEEEGATTHELDPVELFEDLPADLIQEFHEAIKLSNLTRLSAIARKLSEDEATVPAGDYLQERIASFDLVALREIDKGIASAPSAE